MPILRTIVKDRLKEIVPFMGQVRMCGKCVGKYHVEDRLEALMPHPTMDQITNLMPMMAALDPLLIRLATEPGEN